MKMKSYISQASTASMYQQASLRINSSRREHEIDLMKSYNIYGSKQKSRKRIRLLLFLLLFPKPLFCSIADTVAECLFSHGLDLETSVECEWIEHTVYIRRQFIMILGSPQRIKLGISSSFMHVRRILGEYPLHHRPHVRVTRQHTT